MRKRKNVFKRKELGHRKTDTVVSRWGKSKACFGTLVKRKTRYHIVVKIPIRIGEALSKAVISELLKLPKGEVKPITCTSGFIVFKLEKR